MATNTRQVMADQIANLSKKIDNYSIAKKVMTDALVKEVGDSGETFTTSLGDVQVTQKTEDRFADDLVVVFDKEKYLSLDRRTQNRLQALGLVNVDRRKISGQAPKVVVRLK